MCFEFILKSSYVQDIITIIELWNMSNLNRVLEHVKLPTPKHEFHCPWICISFSICLLLIAHYFFIFALFFIKFYRCGYRRKVQLLLVLALFEMIIILTPWADFIWHKERHLNFMRLLLILSSVSAFHCHRYVWSWSYVLILHCQ